MQLTQILSILTGQTGVAGGECPIQETLLDLLEPYGTPRVDILGNILLQTNDEARPRLILEAHMDQIGLIVTHIDADGFLKVDSTGGVDARLLAGQEVTVWGSDEILGIVANLPPHLTKDSGKKAEKVADISIDIGLTRDDAEMAVPLGSYITFATQSKEMLNGTLFSPALDNRAGVASILHCLSMLKYAGVSANLDVLFTVQEELGLRGAKTASFALNAERAIVVDTTFAQSHGLTDGQYARLGYGPAIGISPTLDYSFSKDLIELAGAVNIPFQHEVMGGCSSTNADVVAVSKTGIRTALLSIPIRNMHSPIEVSQISDIENSAKLLTAYIITMGESK